MIRPLEDKVLFTFVESVEKGLFFENTKSGIVLGRSNDATLKNPRWAKVIAVGPEVKHPDIKAGAEVLVDALRWTDSFKDKENDRKVWFTVEKDIMMIKYPDDEESWNWETVDEAGAQIALVKP